MAIIATSNCDELIVEFTHEERSFLFGLLDIASRMWDTDKSAWDIDKPHTHLSEELAELDELLNRDSDQITLLQLRDRIFRAPETIVDDAYVEARWYPDLHLVVAALAND